MGHEGRGLEGRVVLITGGAKRVGAAICRRLHKSGASIMLHFRASAGEARLLQSELNHLRAHSVSLIQADLLDVGKLPSLVEQTVQSFGRLDALVNNASTFYPTTIGNITDIHAERPLKSYVVYSVAKAGLVGLTRSLARELAPDIRVNAVAPGPILWPDEEVFDEIARQRIISHTPLKREGTPDDIAKAVHYLLADAPYVTGETIRVDGGRHVAL